MKASASIVCLLLLLLAGCIKSAGERTLDHKYYLSGNKMYSIEKKYFTVGIKKEILKPDGKATFWSRNGEVLKIENYKDGTLCGEYVEYFPSRKIRVKAYLEAAGIRKHWKEFSENGVCLINEHLTDWNIADSANRRSDIKEKMVMLNDLYQDPESELYFHKSNNLLYSGIAVVPKSADGNIVKSFSILGGSITGIFKSTER